MELSNRAKKDIKDFFVALGLVLLTLGVYATIAIGCYLLFSGSVGDWISMKLGYLIIGLYVFGAALSLWK